MKYKKSLLMRATALTLTLSVAVAGILPALVVGKAGAAGIPTSRKITMSSSAVSATDVIYSVSFVTATTSNVEGLVLDFCSNSPIIGDDTCTAPTGLDLEFGTETVDTQVGVTDWTINTGETTASMITLSRSGGAASVSASTTISFNYNGVRNPSTTNSTFYARLLTFATDALAEAYTSATEGTYVDAGGIALSTAAQIVVTGKVQERLTFCVYTGANCGAGGTAINLGDTNGVLDYANDYTSIAAKFDISTNALSGANVILKGGTLTSGGNTIDAMGATAAAAAHGTEQFGMCLWQSSAGDSNFTPASPYNNGSCNTVTTGMNGNGSANFAFDSAVTEGSTGDDIGTKAAGTASIVTVAFLGNITASTQAGIYTTTLTFIATGTY